MTARKVGLFGGSFDPIHAGHMRPVQAARQALGLDRVIYLPTALPPHKPKRAFAPAHARYAMVELALLDEAGLYASPHELTLGRPAYTIETLEHFARELPGADLHLLDRRRLVRWSSSPGGAGGRSWQRRAWWCSPGRVSTRHRRRRSSSRPPVPQQAASPSSSTSRSTSRPPALRALLARGEAPPPGALARSVLDYVSKYDLYR